MTRRIVLMLCCVLTGVGALAQTLRVLPEVTPGPGEYDDRVVVRCSWPEGCAGGVYYAQGVEILANPYQDSIVLTRSTRLSVAGVDADGRIITQPVTGDYTIRRVSRPTPVPTPAEGDRAESYYTTRVDWVSVESVSMDLSAFKSGGARYGQPVVWLTNAQGTTLTTGDYNCAWESGVNGFRFYLYKNYKQPEGRYTLHIADGIFIVNGERYNQELEFHYTTVAPITQPIFTPESGEYDAPLMVTIRYPQDGSAYYKMYSINGDEPQYYQAPIRLTESATIEAFGLDALSEAETPHTTVTYTVRPMQPDYLPLPDPVMERVGSTLKISCPEPATIKYWFDSRMQTAELYTAPIELTRNTVVSCVAYTETHRSEVVSYTVTDMPEDRGDNGDIVLMTDADLDELHLLALSENGRFAVGYAGLGTSSRGVIWDLSSDILTFPSRAYVGQLLSVSNDGVAYGWCTASSSVDEQTGDDDLIWGTCKDGRWTAKPRELSVTQMCGDGRLRGWVGSKAVFYDPETKQYTEDPLMQRLGKVIAISANEEWAILDQHTRLYVPTMTSYAITPTNYLHPDEPSSEVLYCISNDGTIFGTYDPTLLSPDRGEAIVYTTDNRWRYLADWLRDRDGWLPIMNDYRLTSVRGCTGDGRQLLLHVFPRVTSPSEFYTRGMSVQLDVVVTHLPPVAVQVRQLAGQQALKVQWQIPLMTSTAIRAYRIYRDGELLGEMPANRYEFVDQNVEPGIEYCYTVQAVYVDAESDMSYEACGRCVINQHMPVQDLRVQPQGLADLLVRWQSPVGAIPRLQYFSDEEQSFAFGVSGYDSEWAIRLDKAELSAYKGDSIRTFHVLPTGRQRSYELRLYHGNTSGTSYNTTPFYRQRISPDSLQYGTVNTIVLDEPQALSDSVDLYVALYVESSDNYDVLGVQYEGFRAGYTDLCRVVGVHSRLVSIAEESSVTTELVLPLGIGVCSREQLASGVVAYYLLTDDDRLVATTHRVQSLMQAVEPGLHRLAVTAVYHDGVHSEPGLLDYEMQLNEDAYLPVEDVRVTLLPEQSVRLSWNAPLDEARTHLGWGSMNPTPGLPMPLNLTEFAAGAIIPATLTSDYSEGFEIVAAYFYPTAEASFSLTLDDSNEEDGDMLAELDVKQVQLNQLNYVWLEQPIPLSASVSYRLMVNVSGVAPGVAPLAYDDSGVWNDGFSNLIAYENILATLSDIVQIDEHPNWLIGLLIRRQHAPELPLIGYTITLDGDTQESLITQPQAELRGLSLGEHTACVNVDYKEGVTVEGRAIPFTITVDQALHDATTDGRRQPCYDLFGRPTYAPQRGQVYIYSTNKKIQL